MAKLFEEIDDELAQFLETQPVFFVSTAPLSADGLVNCSPKGNHREFAVLGPRQVAYLDQTGSGVETIAHLNENGRIVLMFCAFSGRPRIIRLHGLGRVRLPGSSAFEAIGERFEGVDGAGVRSIIDVDVTRIADSCGFAVPLMSFVGDRNTLDEWSARKGKDGVRQSQAKNNRVSLDGLVGLQIPVEKT